MKLSIIIVSFNTKKLTLLSIKSIENGGSKIDKEIIVIDNNSKDGSLTALTLLAKRGKIVLIQNNKNTGFAKANNQGIVLAKGKYILLLNSDTVVKRHSLTKLVDFAKKTPNTGIVAARLLNADGSVQPSCLRLPTITNAFREFWLGKRGLFEKYVPAGKTPSRVESVVFACVLIPRKTIEKVGLLNEKFFFYFEDIEYCRRLKKAGLPIFYLPDSEVIHYHGASGTSLADSENQWRRLIPGSKIYHGILKHYLLTAVIWAGQKLRRHE